MGDIWREADDALKAKNVPISMMLEVTRRCNLECVHCYNVPGNSEPSAEQLGDVMRQLREAGCLFLTFTGGEPFVRGDFLDIVSLARKKGFDVKIITNGTLVTPEVADALAKLAPSEVGVSILGATAATHDGLTRVEGSFERSVAGMRAMRERDVPVHLKCTLMKENYGERGEIGELARGLGVLCLMDPIVSPRNDRSREVLEHRLPDDRLEEVYREQFAQAGEDTGEYEPLFCEAGRTFGAVAASGDVYPCIQLPVPVGNVYEKSFERIWTEAPLLEKMREAVKADLRKCATCRHAEKCYRCPGLAYLEEGSAFGPSPTACFVAGAYERYKKGDT